MKSSCSDMSSNLKEEDDVCSGHVEVWMWSVKRFTMDGWFQL